MDLTVNILDNALAPLVADNIQVGTNSGASVSTLLTTVDDNSSVDIEIDLVGYKTYTVTIDSVYMDDKTIEVVLIEDITDIMDADYNKPFPRFFSFNDPCSFDVDVYGSSSFQGNTTWFVNNLEFDAGTKTIASFANPGEYQIKIRTVTHNVTPLTETMWDRQWAGDTVGITGNTVAGVIDPIADYLDDDEETNTTIVEYRVDLSLTIETESETFVDGDATCYVREDEIEVVPTWTLNRPGADPASHTISWVVTGPNGSQVGLFQDMFPLSLSPNEVSAVFNIEELGQYLIEATIKDLDCGTEFTKSIVVDTCNFVVIKYNGCNDYIIENKSGTIDYSYSITNIDGTSTGLTGSVEAGQTAEVSLETFGIYLTNVTYTKDDKEITETYVINNYCELEDCLAQYTLDLLCEDTSRCDPCPPATELNQMLLFQYTYFMKVNQLYATNNFFTGLEDSDLAELTTIQQIAEKLKAFCDRISCNTDCGTARSAGNITYDWAGSGSNATKSCNCNPTPSGSYYSTGKPSYCNTCGGSK